MAEESDVEKSEQASGQRLEKARAEGDIPRSRELATCVLLFTAGLSIWGLGSHLGAALKEMLSTGLTFDSKLAFNTDTSLVRMSDQSIDLMMAFAPLGFALLIAALAAPILVGGWNFNTNALIPNLERMDPIKGLGNLFSKNSLVELVKSIAKTILIGAVAYFVISADFAELITLSLVPVEVALAKTGLFLIKSFIFIAGALIAIALVDVPYQLYRYAENHKMSRQELKQESKEGNGSPEIKAKLRQQQREMSRRRMMSNVQKADVVITNPTHYSVAIQYKEGDMRAPVLLAKGTDTLALRIRELAKEKEILVLESPKLARAIYANTELDSEIPESLYLAVAEILAFVFQVKNFNGRSGTYPAQPHNIFVPDELDPLSNTKQLELAS
ncbi:flagellar biosynthesis protein FlhB [Polynucleobacter sp. AP-Kaivos-20-H2]|uniref:flagellar biosynthesis protein FlhB n=1 Tax=Polynucleobacter sp. AP-Kaivos-20-H2 TaxID=2689104 RepID=UPI001C0C9563|nr:flagellar type III secretion system protein FlhB [Polynucleobacter sp. AP-Kaivos-20-H2]